MRINYTEAMKILTGCTPNNLKLFEHSKRVCENYFNSQNHYSLYGLCLSLLHDLWEDTGLPYDFTDDEYLLSLMRLITHDKDRETYDEYIKTIVDNKKQFPEAYYVKLADIKDHLMLKDTLTDKLKEKYIGALRILL